MTRKHGGALQAGGFAVRSSATSARAGPGGDPGADRNRGGGGGDRLPEGRDPGRRQSRDLVLRSVWGASAACALGIPRATCWPARPLSCGQPPGAGERQPKIVPTSPTPADNSPTLLVYSAYPYPLSCSPPLPMKILLGAGVQSHPVSKKTGLGPRMVVDKPLPSAV